MKNLLLFLFACSLIPAWSQHVDAKPDPIERIQPERDPIPLKPWIFLDSLTYPYEQRSQGVHGMVALKVLVNLQGYYLRHRVISSPHPALTQAVEEKLHLLRYDPALKNGSPCPAWMTIRIRFKLTRRELALLHEEGKVPEGDIFFLD